MAIWQPVFDTRFDPAPAKDTEPKRQNGAVHPASPSSDHEEHIIETLVLQGWCISGSICFFPPIIGWTNGIGESQIGPGVWNDSTSTLVPAACITSDGNRGIVDRRIIFPGQ